jgi:hypothetical protein
MLRNPSNPRLPFSPRLLLYNSLFIKRRMKSNEEEPASLEGLGGLLSAEVLSKFNGSIVFNIYIGGALPKQKTHPSPETHPDPPCVGREKGAGELPEVLSTEAAMTLWQKAQEAGFVDDNLQPLISRTQAALLADAMAMRLGIRNKWKVFETFWNRAKMYKDYYQAVDQKQFLPFQDKLKQILD